MAVAVASLVAATFVSSALGVSGQMRTVYVLTTWNQQSPFTTAETEQVAAQTDAFFRASSTGRFAMPGSVVGPIQLPRSVFNSCDATVVRNAAPPALFEGFDRAVMITPHVDACQFHGEANPTEVFLNGYLSVPPGGPRARPHAQPRAREPVGLRLQAAGSTSTGTRSA